MSSQVDLCRRACPALVVIPGLGWLALALLVGTGGNFTVWPTVACGLMGLLALRLIWHEALLRSDHSIVRIRVHHDQLVAYRRNGGCTPVTVEPSSRLFARVALLKLRRADTINNPDTPGHHRPTQVLILDLPLCSNVDSEAFRRLRVWLRFNGITH